MRDVVFRFVMERGICCLVADAPRARVWRETGGRAGLAELSVTAWTSFSLGGHRERAVRLY